MPLPDDFQLLVLLAQFDIEVDTQLVECAVGRVETGLQVPDGVPRVLQIRIQSVTFALQLVSDGRELSHGPRQVLILTLRFAKLFCDASLNTPHG